MEWRAGAPPPGPGSVSQGSLGSSRPLLAWNDRGPGARPRPRRSKNAGWAQEWYCYCCGYASNRSYWKLCSHCGKHWQTRSPAAQAEAPCFHSWHKAPKSVYQPGPSVDRATSQECSQGDGAPGVAQGATLSQAQVQSELDKIRAARKALQLVPDMADADSLLESKAQALEEQLRDLKPKPHATAVMKKLIAQVHAQQNKVTPMHAQLAQLKSQVREMQKSFRQAKDCYAALIEKWQETSQMDLTNQVWEAQSSDGEDEDMDLGLAAQAPPLPPGRKDRSSPWAQLGKREVGVVGDPVQPEGPKHPRVQTP